MVLGELLAKREGIVESIDLIELFLSEVGSNGTDSIKSKLFELIDQRSSYDILIDEYYNTIMATVGDKSLSLANVKILIKSLQSKISMLNSEIIYSDNKYEYKLSLLNESLALKAEKDMLSGAVEKAIWTVEVE